MSKTITRDVASTITRASGKGVINKPSDLGYELGRVERLTLDASLAVHKQWIKLDAAQQKVDRTMFLAGYVAGRSGVSLEVGEKIVNMKRAERSPERERLVNAGAKLFAYHVARNVKKAAGKAREPQVVRVATDFKAAAITFVEQFYEEANAAAIGEVIKQLQAMKKRVK